MRNRALWHNQNTTPPFRPSNLSNMVAWWKADSLSLNDGDAVASWTDSSGGGNTLSQATSGKRPVYKSAILNGYPVVRFTAASGQYLGLGASFLDPAVKHTIYVVSKAATVHDGSLCGNIDSNGFIFRYLNTASVLQLRTYSPLFDVNSTALAGSFSYVTLLQNATSTVAGVSTFRQNGAGLGSSSSDVQLVPDRNFAVGADGSNGTTTLNGDIAEFIIYTGVHNSTDYGKVETYLKNRYGL